MCVRSHVPVCSHIDACGDANQKEEESGATTAHKSGTSKFRLKRASCHHPSPCFAKKLFFSLPNGTDYTAPLPSSRSLAATGKRSYDINKPMIICSVLPGKRNRFVTGDNLQASA